MGGASLIAQVVRLISDDQVIVWSDGDYPIASAPAAIAGKLEVRGVGIIAVTAVTGVRVALVVELIDPSIPIDRMPEPAHTHICGHAIPMIRLHAFEASAPVKLLAAAQALT